MRSHLAGRPLELWLVIAAFAVPGGWLAIAAVRLLPDIVRAMGLPLLGVRLGLALLLATVLLGLVGVGMVWLAWRLYRVDRVARGLAYAVAVAIVVAVAFSGSRSTAEEVAMALAVLGCAILALSPQVRELFERGPAGAEPTALVVGRTLIAIFGIVGVIVGAVYLLLSEVAGRYAIVGGVALVAALLAWRASQRVVAGDRGARRQLTAGAVVVAVLLVAAGRTDTGLLLPLGLMAAALGCLWLPADARAAFGDPPLRIGAAGGG